MCCLGTVLLSGVVSGATSHRRVAWITPEKPKAGDSITVWYRYNDPTSAFHDGSQALAELYCFSDFPDDPGSMSMPTVLQAQLLPADSLMKAKFKLNVPGVKFIIYKFESTEEIDDNNGDLWNSLIYDSTGKPVFQSLECRSWAYSGFASDSSYRMRRDISLAADDIREELKLYPQSFSAWNAYFMLEKMHANGVSPEFAAKIDSVMDHYALSANEYSAPRIAKWYGVLGRRDKLIAMENAWMQNHSSGNYRIYIEFSRAKSIKNAKEMGLAVRNLVISTADDSGWAVDIVREWLLTYYLQDAKITEADNVWKRLIHPQTRLAIRLAEAYVDSGQGLDRAKEILNEASRAEHERPTFVGRKSLTMNDGRERQMILQIQIETALGRVEEAMHNTDSALLHYSQALCAANMDDSASADGMLRCLERTPIGDKSAAMLGMMLKTTITYDSLRARVASLYAKIRGQRMPYDVMAAKVQTLMQIEREHEFCKRVLRFMSPQWSCQALHGPAISSAACKGKVVVMEFWGTWCEPCKITMPAFDKVYKKFASDTNIAFVAIDTHEPENDADSIRQKIRTFLTDSSFTVRPTVPIYIDPLVSVAEAFNVVFFPTFVLIDQAGVVRVMQFTFPDEDIAAKLAIQIDILRRGVCGAPRKRIQ